MRYRFCLFLTTLVLSAGPVMVLSQPRLQLLAMESQAALSADKLYQKGLRKARLEEYPAALALLNRAVAQDSTLAKAYKARASVRCHLGDKAGAIE